MRAGTIVAIAVLALAEHLHGQAAPQPPQQPVFRAGVELVTVDVTALDSNGRQITDLTTAEFLVDIDGDRRQVTSAEYVRSADPLRVIGTPHKVVVPDETFSSSNTKGAPSGRLIVILVDQGNIRTGSARAVMMSAKKFVDTLTPEDRVAVIAVPGPGELVDFTTNHDKVRESLLRIVGQSSALRTRFNLSVTESMAIYMRSDAQLALEVILRECGQVVAVAEAERCEREVEQDAAEVVNEVRQRTQDSVHGMRAVLKSIGAMDGPKSVILISEGLIFEGLGTETDDLASVAADSRATLDVMLLDGYYLLGVESRPGDRDGRRHRLSVRSARRGVSIRSRRTFLTTVSGKSTTPTDAVNRAIRSILPINDLPLKVSTWTYKEPGTSKVRVLIAAEVERLAGQSLQYTTGLAVVNKQGRGIAPPTELKTLIEKPGEPGTAIFNGMVTIDPGEYRLILSMSDSEGRVGSVSRAVTAWGMDAAGVALGDLLVGGFAPGDKAALSPAIEPAISGGYMGALVEVYGKDLAGIDARLEIIADENSKPLATQPMRSSAGSSPEIASMSAQFNTTALPPGRYLARGVITQAGKVHGHLLRPFRIVTEGAAGVSTATAPSTGGALPGEMTMLLLGGLANFDRKDLLTPATLTSAFAAAEARPAGSRAAAKEARAGDLGGAAMTALAENDQVLAMFLKGLELYQQSQVERAAMQFQNSMQMAPAFTPSRLFLGAALAEANRHREAAGLLQSAIMTLGAEASAPGAAPNAAIARLAGEEWIKAGLPQLAIPPLELAVQQPTAEPRARKVLGIAYVLGGRPADAVAPLTVYLDAHPTDAAALLPALFGTYIRHLNAPQPATLAADRTNMAKWAKAYAATKGPMQPLVGTWVGFIQNLK